MPSPLPRWNRLPRWGKILYALTSTAALLAALVYVVPELRKPDTCHDGIEKIDDQCIGVDGAGYDFGTSEISAVAEAIAAENEKIDDTPHVTVAVMLPLQSQAAGLRRQMRSDLQGAYLGQRQSNAGDGNLPKIRLVLANPGRNYAHQDKVVNTLLDMSKSDSDNLRAVTGFNLSLEATKKAVARLTENGVPVLASRITGDDIANVEGAEQQRFPGLARILPTNKNAAKALASFSGEEGRENARTVLVHDTRRDTYNDSLASAFRGIEETGPAGPADMPFTSPAIDRSGTTGSQFKQIANNICDSKADTVYFAGRTRHLRIFALTLAGQTCADRHFTLISGSDAASLRQGMSKKNWAELRGEDGSAKVTVQYAAPAHPEAWETELSEWIKDWKKTNDGEPRKGQLPQYLTEPKAALDQLEKLIDDTAAEGIDLGSVPDLDDSRTMLVHDGVLTVGTALHKVQGTDETRVPSLTDLSQQWSKLHSRHRIKGTSGLICLTSDGNSYNKPVSVVRLHPGKDGEGTLKFAGLAWPTGKEQPENCVIPSDTP
ncbi:amino acid ABC transporter substrate-binding protein [Streptomyces sp. XM4193]|uniref:ABC transporter substrate-binding protein n=1 Tax=Streptomyces sp. XM4193 TaxID=2929782 RepID=UPI001FF74CDC|nr:amino acid ABC transporter substrate-binding protein [Streptomyces sp. XM4193]MCK1794732.1 amino acid ABC transporter substrate-binding protein [Streptomyces sp. XM4193]